MREIFLAYAKERAMTKEDVAKALNLKPETVRRMAKSGKIPRIGGIGALRFDGAVLADLFCPLQGEQSPRSLTIERHKTGVKTVGGYRQCL